jgi:predicted chitinase
MVANILVEDRFWLTGRSNYARYGTMIGQDLLGSSLVIKYFGYCC